MSRTRRLGKYKGASFADEFKANSKGFQPMFSGPASTMKDMIRMKHKEMQKVATKVGGDMNEDFSYDMIDGKPVARPNNNKPTSEDTVPERVGDRRGSIEAYKAGSKKAKEDAAAAAAAEAEAEAEKEKLMEEYTAEGYTDDYKEGMTSKEARLEHKENKGELKDQYKIAKGDAKARKKSGEISGKEYRAIKKEEKGKKKEAKKSSKCKKKAAQGKSSKSWYRKNCL